MILSNLPYFKNLKQGSIFLTFWLLISACSSNQLPEIRPLSQKSAILLETQCENAFLHKKAQFIHALEVTLPGKNMSSVIGITNVDPEKKTLESIIMSIEGLILFHARYSKSGKEVINSIDPFTSEYFSTGLLQDIQLIFLVPDGNLGVLGTTRNNTRICRYASKDKITDIHLLKNGNWIINQYNSRQRLTKSLEASEIDSTSDDSLKRYPRKMVLENTGFMGYSLSMKLIRLEYTE